MVNHYLVAAYALAWLIFGLYAWSLSRRQAKLRKELDDLKRKLPGVNASGNAA